MVYVIAEIGKNGDGDPGRCAELVRAVHRAGADAVRFAHFSLDASVHPDALRPGAERAWSLALELPFRSEQLFDADGYRRILDLCGELGLDLVGTPWDLPSLEVLQAAGVTDYAVNSINAYNLPTAQRILAAARRSYVSTGGLGEPQVKRLVEALDLSSRDAVLMHAVTAYPAPLSTLNLRALRVLQRYHRDVGYSSNDLVPTAPLAAVANGASVIGKHVHLLDGAGPTHRASISADTLTALVAQLREFEAAAGEERKHESRGEMANRDVLAKGLVLARPLTKGQLIGAGDLALQLPPKGVLAQEWFDVLGRPAARDLTAGDYLYTADVDADRGDDDSLGERGIVPGERGVVVRLKDIDEMTTDRDFDYVEVHYAASDIGRPDTFDEYDLDVVVHVPEYADGVLLDLCSYDEALRRFSIEVIDQVMAKARALRPRFTRGGDLVRFVIHPGALTHPGPLADPSRQYELFADAMRRMNTDGLDVLVENMTPFAWFLAGDWSPRQGVSNSFLDPRAIRSFVEQHGYRMTLDLCHAQLYCNHTGTTLREYMEVVRPVVGHLHFSDATGIDGEGIRVGTGDIDWRGVCETFAGHTGGWTPEIWNGHHDHGAKFCQAHRDLNAQFRLYGPAPCEP